MSFLEKKEANHARGMNFPTAGPSWEATRAGPGRVTPQQDARWGFCPNPCQHRGGQGWPHRPAALGETGTEREGGGRGARRNQLLARGRGSPIPPACLSFPITPSLPLSRPYLAHPGFPLAHGFPPLHRLPQPPLACSTGGPSPTRGSPPQKKNPPLHPLGPRVPLGSPKNGVQPNGAGGI